MSGPSERRPYVQRTELGSYYADGVRLAELEGIEALGYVYLRDSVTGRAFGMGISAFRRAWWRAK